MLSAVPIVKIGGINYRQFLLDINQTSINPLLSLNELKIYQTDVGSLTGYPASFGVAIYDLDGAGNSTIELNNNLNIGSGEGDMFAYIPDSLFNAKPYVYLYSSFGVSHGSNGGYEEWATFDGCPNDPNKTSPGICGCGISDTDTDGDGTPDCTDGCPNDPNKIATGVCRLRNAGYRH